MREEIESRVKELKAELESGRKIMEELDAKRVNIMYTLLRISGAIQALEEVEQKEEDETV
jgi:hypothetical protein